MGRSSVHCRTISARSASLLVYDDTDAPPDILAPVMLIWGAADVLVTREMQDDLQRLLSHVELRIYKGAGHTPRWEQPERFARDVTAFAAQAFP